MNFPTITRLRTQYERDQAKHKAHDRAWLAAGAWVLCVIVAASVLAVIS